MLVGFHVGNFLSFDGRQRFTMICMPRSTIPECAVTFDGYGLLRMSAVYGANGSGKSNLLRSMGAMRSLVVDEIPPAINGYHVSERRNEAEPSLFDMEIRIGDRTYGYGFDYMVRKQEVVDEWLHEIFVGRESKVLFERTGGTIVHSFEGRDATAVDSCAQDIPDMPGRLFLNEMYRHMCIDGAGPEIIAKVTAYRQQIRWACGVVMTHSAQLLEIKSVNDGMADANAAAVQVFIAYSQQLRTALFGKAAAGAAEKTVLTGGARILEIFAKDFANTLQALDARACVGIQAIRTAIVNNRGIHGGLFASEKALETLIRACLAQLEAPCKLCVEQVKTEFQNVVGEVQMAELQYFPKLREAMIRETLQLLDEKAGVTQEMVHILLEMEKAYINTALEAISADNIKRLQGGAISTARAVRPA